MQKIVAADAYDYDMPQLAEIPISRRPSGSVGLGAHDAQTFLKRASSDLLHKLASVQFQPGEVPVHLIAVGCTEAYGPNRNGDGFREPVCRLTHPTFVKFAHFFRGHKSRPTDPRYGSVKLSYYNDVMRRIELVVGLFGDEACARRNDGHVADIELRKLAAAQDVPTSMGCAVPYDVCSGCGNKAKTREFYCDARMCKAGGLKYNMGQLLPDGSILHADNTEPRFNDISHVPRQADRISYVLGLMQKAAGTGRAPIVSGAELAELFYPADSTSKWAKMAAKLADVEADGLDKYLGLAPGVSHTGRSRTFVPLPMRTVPKFAQALAALADEGVILPAEEFAALLSGRPDGCGVQLKQACVGLFARLTPPTHNPYEHAGAISFDYKGWAGQLAQDYSLKEAAVRRRLAAAVVRGAQPPSLLPMMKSAADNPLVEELAQQYGLYVLAALDRPAFRNSNLPLTTALAVLQNRLA